MFDAEAIRVATFDNYVRLCRLQEWKEWAWQEVKRMDEDDLFKGIKAHVLGEMNATRSQG